MDSKFAQSWVPQGQVPWNEHFRFLHKALAPRSKFLPSFENSFSKCLIKTGRMDLLTKSHSGDLSYIPKQRQVTNEDKAFRVSVLVACRVMANASAHNPGAPGLFLVSRPLRADGLYFEPKSPEIDEEVAVIRNIEDSVASVACSEIQEVRKWIYHALSYDPKKYYGHKEALLICKWWVKGGWAELNALTQDELQESFFGDPRREIWESNLERLEQACLQWQKSPSDRWDSFWVLFGEQLCRGDPIGGQATTTRLKTIDQVGFGDLLQLRPNESVEHKNVLACMAKAAEDLTTDVRRSRCGEEHGLELEDGWTVISVTEASLTWEVIE